MIIELSEPTKSIIGKIARLQGVSIERFFIMSAYKKALQLSHNNNANQGALNFEHTQIQLSQPCLIGVLSILINSLANFRLPKPN